MVRARYARLALRAPLLLAGGAGLFALVSAGLDLHALRVYDRAPRTLAGSPQGPVVIEATVSAWVENERLLAGPSGDAVLTNDDYDALQKGAFDEHGPPRGSRVVFIGCAYRDAPGGGTRLAPCPHLPSTLRHDAETFLGALRAGAVRGLLAFAFTCGLAGLWIASMWMALARQRAGSEHVAEDGFENRLGLPIWIRPAGEERQPMEVP